MTDLEKICSLSFLLTKAAKMRQAQKEYFHYRSTSFLEIAKQMERDFDKALIAYTDELKNNQTKLPF